MSRLSLGWKDPETGIGSASIGVSHDPSCAGDERILTMHDPSDDPTYDADVVLLKSNTRQADWRRANPLKYRAHLVVHRALVSGQIQKEPCEVCGAETVDAHHDRYDEPLNIRWLCRRHHIKLHRYGEDMFPISGPRKADR